MPKRRKLEFFPALIVCIILFILFTLSRPIPFKKNPSLSCLRNNNTLTCEWHNCTIFEESQLIAAGEPNYVSIIEVDKPSGRASFFVSQIKRIYVYLECKNGKIARVIE